MLAAAAIMSAGLAHGISVVTYGEKLESAVTSSSNSPEFATPSASAALPAFVFALALLLSVPSAMPPF